MFFDNAMLAFAKANLRAAVNRWDMVIAKHNKLRPTITPQQIIAELSVSRKFGQTYRDAVAATELLKAKF